MRGFLDLKTFLSIILLIVFGGEQADASIISSGGVAQIGSVTSGHVAVWNGTGTAQGIRDGGTGQTVLSNLGGCYILAASGAASSHTGDTAEFALATVTVPANSLGANGFLIILSQWSYTVNADTKTVRIRFGSISGSQYMSNSPSATQATMRDFPRVIQNRNATNSQVGGVSSATAGYGPTTGAVVTSAIDTTNSTSIVFTGQLGTISDTVTLENYAVELCHAN